jgi:hypothetical protein
VISAEKTSRYREALERLQGAAQFDMPQAVETLLSLSNDVNYSLAASPAPANAGESEQGRVA